MTVSQVLLNQFSLKPAAKFFEMLARASNVGVYIQHPVPGIGRSLFISNGIENNAQVGKRAKVTGLQGEGTLDISQ